MLLRKTPLSRKLTSEEVEAKLRDVVRKAADVQSELLAYIVITESVYFKPAILYDFQYSVLTDEEVLVCLGLVRCCSDHLVLLLFFILQLLVLKYVQNKDVFMRYHKAHLTRRLILDTSADNEKEENMVEWLRVS